MFSDNKIQTKSNSSKKREMYKSSSTPSVEKILMREREGERERGGVMLDTYIDADFSLSSSCQLV